MDAILLDGKSLTLKAAQEIALGKAVALDPACRGQVEASAAFVEKKAAGRAPIYGVNTGFGALAACKIPKSELYTLQRNILKSHAAGFGSPLSQAETRLALALRLNVLMKGLTGVRWALCERFIQFLDKGIYPLIPEYGSVGASGDLAPLAHLALPLIGQGEVFYKGKQMPAKKALSLAKLKPLKLKAKEGLGLVNGTQIMLAVGTLALAEALELATTADKIAALSFEGLHADPGVLATEIHLARGQAGQIASAAAMRAELEGSYLYTSKEKRLRVQDPYSLRCAAQVHGASRDMLLHTVSVLETELNAATDNPLVFEAEGCFRNGGNFHGQPLALALDAAALAVAELGNISERRLDLLLNPHFSGLPAFLSPHPGTCSGYMAAQYLAASLVNENKLLANPSSTDSIPGNCGVEDHVSMGSTSARKLRKMVQHLKTILAVEWLAATQAVDLRGATPLGKGTKTSHHTLRKAVSRLNEDRIISYDIAEATNIIPQLYTRSSSILEFWAASKPRG